MSAKKYVDSKFKENFPNWARIQIADEMENFSRNTSMKFVEWLIENGHIARNEATEKRTFYHLWKKFSKDG